MYAFICSDTLHSKCIRTVVLEEYLLSDLKFNKESNLKFFKEIGGEVIRINCISANSQGNYAYVSLEGVEEINLIAVPWKVTGDSEKVVIDIANDITKQFSWMMDENRTKLQMTKKPLHCQEWLCLYKLMYICGQTVLCA